MKVLITGGLGFIGSNLAHRLVAEGHYVTLVDSLVPEYGGNLFNISGIEDAVRVNISDVRDQYSLCHLVKDQDVLFNLAGQTSHMDSMSRPEIDLDINCKAQLSILEACRHHNPRIRVVYGSTRQIYGKPRYLPVDEKHPLDPVDVNGINKLAGEQYHLLYGKVYGLATCVLRLTNIVGPRMRIKDARQTFLGVWIRNLIDGKPIEVWGGEQLRDILDVSDCVDALLLAAGSEKSSGQIYNVGSKESINLIDLAKLLVELNGGGEISVRTYPAERKSIDIGDYYTNAEKIHAELGWKPKVTLREGLAGLLSFYRENLPHYV